MGASTGDVNALTFASAAVVGFALLYVVRKAFRKSSLDAIPSVGVPKGPLGFYLGAWNLLKNGRAIIDEGYRKYQGRAFKVVLANQWLVVLPARSALEDIRKAPDEILSAAEGVNSLIYFEYTLGHELHVDPYQVNVVRTQVTRNIGVAFPDLRDEVVAAFAELIPATEDWTSIPMMQTMLPIVSRVANRLFVGLPICRNPEYIKITTEFAVGVMKDVTLLHLVPSILRPAVARCFGHRERAIRATLKLVGPVIQHRLEMDDKYGKEWPDGDRPSDMISWLVDEARGHPTRRTVRGLTQALLLVNFGAIHTTTQAFLTALYNLAVNLECVEPLRQEIESTVKQDGWTKASLGKMVKLDSFMKECARYSPGGAAGIMRQAIKDFTFSDGTTVPAGTLVSVPVLPEHHEEENAKLDVFDPFRFARMREGAGEAIKHHMVTPSHDFLVFGIGRHACPGRFFAVNEQKLIMAHVLLTYDIMVKDGTRPADEWVAIMSSANPTAEVMFRKRK